MQRSPLLLAVAALAAFVPVAESAAVETPRSPVMGQEPGPDLGAAPKAPEGSIRLVRQPSWVAPETSADFVLDIDPPAGAAEVRVVVHRAVTSRGAFQEAMSGERLGRVAGRLSVPASELPGDGPRRTLTLGIEGADPDPQRLVPGRSGVYPVEVELLSSEGRVDGFITPLVVLAPGVVPLTVSWLWPLDATPAHLPSGQIRPTAARAMAPGGRLARMVAAAARHPDIPLTLAPTPETLEAWADLAESDSGPEGVADTLAAARTILPPATTATRQVLAGPYVPVDIPTALANDLDTEVDDQFFQGPAALAEVLGADASPATVQAGRLDVPSLARLRLYGTERVVVDPETLEAPSQRLTPARPFLIPGRGKPVPGAVNDPDLASLLLGDDPSGLRVARFTAALSLVALEAPRTPRGVVVSPPRDWDPPAALLDGVLDALRNHPALSPKVLDGYFADVPLEGEDGSPVERELGEPEPTPGAVTQAQLAALRDLLGAFGEILGDDRELAGQVDRGLLIAQSSELPAAGRLSAAHYLQGAKELMAGITGRVRGPDGRVTLTARKATIPISLLNPTGHPLHVRVRLESDQLLFPDGSERVLTLPPENTTENFKVETRASGAFPLTITVTSPDGRLLVASSELTVRSTVVSGVGAMLTAGAGLFLLLWWANDLRRGGRRRRARARQNRVSTLTQTA
jgi:hypothetical protein